MNRLASAATVGVIGTLLALSVGAGGAVGQLLDPCRLLAAAHPETAFGKATPLSVSPGRRSHDYSGVDTADCTETVGEYRVWLRVSTEFRGVTPAGVVRLSEPVRGVASGRLERIRFHGTSSQWIFFHRGVPPYSPRAMYVGITLLGLKTNTAALETLARRLYKRL